MPRQHIQLINGEVYHICYRAVGDSDIFRDEDDHFRGIFALYEFNNDVPVQMWIRRQRRKREKIMTNKNPDKAFIPIRDGLVEILAFCFMPNHIHLLVKQVKDGGVSKFMKKTGGGYANFFNKKYQRKGHLFNQFKAIHIKTDDQLQNVLNYIHCNPISLIEPGWKENGIKDVNKVINFLEDEYRWSSYWDYLGKSNFSSVTSRDFLLEIFRGVDGIKSGMNNWIIYKNNINQAVKGNNSIFLE